jgi:hypothetical protein
MNYFTKEKPRLIWAIQTVTYGSDLIKTRSYFCYNPDHPSKIERLGIVFSIWPASARTERREAPWPGLGQAEA